MGNRPKTYKQFQEKSETEAREMGVIINTMYDTSVIKRGLRSRLLDIATLLESCSVVIGGLLERIEVLTNENEDLKRQLKARDMIDRIEGE